MRRRGVTTAILGLVLLAACRPARAGMPTVMLSDMARARFQTISFFLLVFLLSAWGVQTIWNALRADFPGLPRLSYRKGVGLVTLWGLLFLLVLTMISGARELMTPGAWKKQGLTYRLANEAPRSAGEEGPEEARRGKLERLRRALWQYADTHAGRFPPDDRAPEIPPALWQIPDPSGLRYLYVKGRTADQGAVPLVYEPGLYGGDRLVLLADGTVRPMPLAEIRRALEPGRP